MFNRKQSKSRRASILLDELQAAITAAVRKADPACEAFIGVVIEPLGRSSVEEANWAIKGVRFGKADRRKASSALETIVKRLQQEFDLPSNGSSSKAKPAN